MFDGADLTYIYDGSFEGLLCCVFESYDKKEIPSYIFAPYDEQISLFPPKQILTDTQRANRVRQSIPKKMGRDALDFVKHCFLTCLPQKELYILKFLRMGFMYGYSVMNMLTDDVVNTLLKAHKHLMNESHLYKGFVRFSIFNNALVSEIEPKNYVLPLIAPHFCERYLEEHFLIFDKTHHMALVYEPYQYRIIAIDELSMPSPDEEELKYRRLWKMFYDTIEIQGRHNPKCRMGHMPKRYWRYLTEFNCDRKDNAKINGEIKRRELKE